MEWREITVFFAWAASGSAVAREGAGHCGWEGGVVVVKRR